MINAVKIFTSNITIITSAIMTNAMLNLNRNINPFKFIYLSYSFLQPLQRSRPHNSISRIYIVTHFRFLRLGKEHAVPQLLAPSETPGKNSGSYIMHLLTAGTFQAEPTAITARSATLIHSQCSLLSSRPDCSTKKKQQGTTIEQPAVSKQRETSRSALADEKRRC